MSEPVLVFLLSSNCMWCDYLLKNWDVTVNALVSVYPNIRFPLPIEETKKYKYPPIILNHNQLHPSYPKDLLNYHILWAPMILLIPGNVWDECMLNLNKKLYNMEIMNSNMINNKIEYLQKWDIRKPENFSNWLLEALKIKNIKILDEPKTKIELKCQHVLNLISYY